MGPAAGGPRWACPSACIFRWPSLAWPCRHALKISTQTSDTYNALFHQMFVHPADLDTTFRFAHLAVERGDYEAAIGALERMLFFNPKLPRVRLELGVLYFKIGSYEMAQSYLDGALQGNPPADIRAQIEVYLAEIQRRLSPTKFAATFFTGLRYQSNANAGPDGTLVRAYGQNALLGNQYAHAPDWNWFGQFSGFYSHDLGDQSGAAIEASLTGYYGKQFKFSQFDLGLLELKAGPRLPFLGGSSIHFYGIANAQSLASDPYLVTGGAGVSARFAVHSISIEPALEYRHREFLDSGTYPTASQQTGNLVSASATIQSQAGPLRWLGRLAYEHNSAAFAYDSYDRFSYEFNLPLVLNEWTVTPLVGGSFTDYGAPDPVVDPSVTRNDTEFHFGLTVDRPLHKNFGLHGEVLVSTTSSSLPNFDERNVTVVFGPTARF